MLLASKCLYALQAAELSSSGRWVFSKCLVALREVLQPVAVAALSSVRFFAYPWQWSSIFVFAINDESKSMRKKKKKNRRGFLVHAAESTFLADRDGKPPITGEDCWHCCDVH
jgi:hypothetical protein